MADSHRALGYQQVTALTSAAALTVPAGTKFILMQCTGQQVRWRDDGTNPTAAIGMVMVVNELYKYDGTGLAALRFIEAAATAVLNVSYYG